MLSAMLSGGAPSLKKYAEGVKLSMAYEFFAQVKQAFIQKSRGGVDENGDSWHRLSPEYLAYGRYDKERGKWVNGRKFGKGEQAALKKDAGLGKANNQRIGNGQTLLDKKQADLWWSTYRRNLAIAIETLPVRDAKAKAASIAWSVVKRAGGKTKLDVYGSRSVEILRDTGVLLNSLSPGVLSSDSYRSPPPKKDGGQVVRPTSNALIVGTNVKYAGAHHYGIHVPKRRLWPAGDRLPQRWIELFSKRITNGVIKAVNELSQ